MGRKQGGFDRINYKIQMIFLIFYFVAESFNNRTKHLICCLHTSSHARSKIGKIRICVIKFASFYRNIQISFLFLYSVKLVSKPHKNQALDCDTSTQNSIVERKNDPRVPQADFWDFEGGDGG